MAFTLGDTSRGRGRFRGSSTLAEINIVPLVDVVLVLLIIFMLTAHVMEFGLEINVPKVNRTKDTTRELPVVSMQRDGSTYVNGKPVNINLLASVMKQLFPGASSVYLQADRETPFEQVAQVISALGDAQFQVNIVTQPLDEADKRR
jgi:biopolymer transport protein ExbD/biopolymer transport protein TolR